MARRLKSAGLVAALLAVFIPFFALATGVNIGVDPAEVRIDNLRPGETTEFELTIHNHDSITRRFVLAASAPPEGEETEGITQVFDGNWISFSSTQMEIAPFGEAKVTVTVAIPREQRWASQDWEIWLGVTAESTDPLSVRLYTHLLVSTGSMVKPGPNIGFFVGIGLAAILVGCGAYYYFRRRARFD